MSEPTPPPQSNGWQVNAQQETTELALNGAFVSGRRVYFTTGAGNTGSVFLPDQAYTVDNVRAAIEQQATKLDAIGALSSDGG